MSAGTGMRLETRLGQWTRFIGESEGIQQMKRLLERLAPTEETVVLQGETGVGKEVAAQEIHAMSDRADGPFIVVDCSSLAKELIENELFGHARGAFTSAHHPAMGLIEAADGGTLFIDQVEDMPLHLQVRFLRVAENREIRRIGKTEYRPVDVRLIVATGVDLQAMVEKKEFRSDLFYRLYEFPVVIPPLRERNGDISLLATYFLRGIDEEGEKRFTSGALEFLGGHSWPGNVRELKNVVKRATRFLAGEKIDSENVKAALAVRTALDGAFVQKSLPAVATGARTFKEKRKEERVEQDRAEIRSLLEEYKGNLTKVANRMEMSYRWLSLKVDQLGLRSLAREYRKQL